MAREEDLFYFLQCSTPASPEDPKWPLRIKEEKYALLKLAEYVDYLEKTSSSKRWFAIRPVDEMATRWEGRVSNMGKDFKIEMVLKESYPHTPPVARIPELMKYTDRKLDDPILGLKLCDMHMEQNYWWNEFCGIALYLKREVSYWVQAVVFNLEQKGWLEHVKGM